MNWKNAATDGFPHTNDMLLLCVDGKYQLGTYDQTRRGFRLKEGQYFFPVDYRSVYWITLPAGVVSSVQDQVNRHTKVNQQE